jgi:hypothetical protein
MSADEAAVAINSTFIVFDGCFGLKFAVQNLARFM